MVTPVLLDLLYSTPPLPGTPVWPAEVLVGNAQNVLGGVPGSFFPQTTLYVGLMVAAPWSAGASVSSTGASPTYVVAEYDQDFATVNRHVFVCTQSGVTGSTEPGWD